MSPTRTGDEEDLPLAFEERASKSLLNVGKEHSTQLLRWNDANWTYFDVAMISVQGGNGGDGCKSFMRQRCMPLMGPDGGNGGNGGHVYLKATKGQTSLHRLKHQVHYAAVRGAHGMGKHRHGKTGVHRVLEVPVGSVVYVRDAWLKGQPKGHVAGKNELITTEDVNELHLAGELLEPGQMLRVARGGRGGRGNASYKSQSNNAPWIREKGEKGMTRWIEIVLKMVADIGIIGMPNAGKSSLLSMVTNKLPKIAAYPFTTVVPNLGFHKANDHGGVTMCDIPGIIEGASEGRGMGFQFLRHIERCQTLIHMVSGSSDNPIRDFEAIQNELRIYSSEVAQKPQVVVVNKIDIPEVRERLPELMAELRQRAGHSRVFAISAATRDNVDELMRRVFKWHTSIMAKDLDSDPYSDKSLIVGSRQLFHLGGGLQPVEDREPVELDKERPRGKAFRVSVEPRVEWDVLDGAWRLLHPEVERLATQISWSWGDEHTRFNNTCKAVGLTDILARKVKDGDPIIVGSHKFTYEPGMIGKESRMLIYEINLDY